MTMLGLVPSICKAWRHSDCIRGLDWSHIRCDFLSERPFSGRPVNNEEGKQGFESLVKPGSLLAVVDSVLEGGLECLLIILFS